MRTVIALLLIVACLPAQEKRPVDKDKKPIEVDWEAFADNWPRYSKKLVESWRKDKILQGSYLQKGRRLTKQVTKDFRRLKKAEHVESLFTEKARGAFLSWVASLKRSRSREKVKLRAFIEQLRGRLAAVNALDSIAGAIQRDLKSWHLHMKNAVGKFEKGKGKRKMRQVEILPALVVAFYAKGYVDDADDIGKAIIDAVDWLETRIEDL